MDIKDNYEEIKKEFTSQEQLLENLIKSERFFKKYGKLIIVIVILLMFYGIGYSVYTYMQNKKIENANVAYSKLILNPNDTQALDNLKENNINLYALYKFKVASKSNNINDLKELANLKGVDSVLKDIINLQATDTSSIVLVNYATLLKGYKLLEQNKTEAANIEFSKIPVNSELSGIIESLKHYNGIKQ